MNPWSSIYSIPRDRRHAVTRDLFSHLRWLQRKATGAGCNTGRLSYPTYGGDSATARKFRHFDLLLSSFAHKFVDDLPLTERLITIYALFHRCKEGEVLQHLRHHGVILARRTYWRRYGGPDNGTQPRRPAVVDYWTLFTCQHHALIPSKITDLVIR